VGFYVIRREIFGYKIFYFCIGSQAAAAGDDDDFDYIPIIYFCGPVSFLKC
jgi:hypothetical protein